MEEQEEQVETGGRNRLWDWLPTLLAFLVIYLVLWVFFGRWPFGSNLLFSLTTTAGGDMGAHHYPAQYLIQELLPNFRLTGWAPGWYAGMPMLTFYFPFPFLLIAILNWFLPYQIAFKLITVLGVFALPLTVYAMGRLWRMRKPFAVMSAVMALAFLLMEHTGEKQLYSIYGGNILSTLAGEFGYMLSFALVFLFLGTIYRGMEKPRFNMLFVLNCLILMALTLSHIVTTMILVCIIPGLLLVHWRWRSLGYLAAVGIVGFCLTAFWSLPFAADLEWTGQTFWTQLHSISYLFPSALLPVAVLGFIGMAYAVARKERKLLPLAWTTVVIFALFWLLPTGRLWNGRILPFWYISFHLWAAYALTWLVRPFAVMFSDLFHLRGKIARRVYVPVTAVAVAAIVGLVSSVAGGWIEWNYSGYEGKPNWTQYQEINDYLDTLDPPGRVMVEHGDKLDEFGTPRAFEIIPYWTRQDTMEGTLMEASFTAPFHFFNLAELSDDGGSGALDTMGVKNPGLDVAAGITRLQLMNIPYFLAFYNEDKEEKVVTGLLADSRAELLATFGDYNIFRISGCSGYVQVMKNQPVRLDVEQSEWRDLAVEWYKNDDALDTPIVWDNGEEALQEYASITPDQVESPPEVPVETEGYVTNELLSNESLEFDTTAIGKPHWIKVSYFPNWHVEGADGPYLVSPSFMMVIPRQGHVVLTYGRTAANTMGQVLEGLAWALLLGLTIWRLVRWLRRRRLAEAVLESQPIFSESPPTGGLGAGAADRERDAGLEDGEDSSYYVDDGSDYREAVEGTEPVGDASIDRDERPGV